jgi:hypothetical protein
VQAVGRIGPLLNLGDEDRVQTHGLHAKESSMNRHWISSAYRWVRMLGDEDRVQTHGLHAEPLGKLTQNIADSEVLNEVMWVRMLAWT